MTHFNTFLVYKFFDKKSVRGGAKHVNTKLATQNQQLAEKLHKPIIKKFETRKVHAAFKDNIWDADLADMQLLYRYNKGIRFLLCVIDIFIKYAWVVPLKDKKGVSIVTAFQSILKQSNRKPNKIWVDKGSEFYNVLLKSGCKIMILLCIQQILKENLLLQKDLLEC